ncbi:MAG: class I SAM-dependent methyltransferase [Thermoleophilaceae bacterium]|nr:class I SAM-dependent methyltransferase [Thermoleophilaceae bacterium]
MSRVEDPTHWDERSRLDPLAAVLDPAAGSGPRNAHITRIHELALERSLDLRGDERVLDFGAGTGRLLGLLARRAGQAVGAEISPGMAESANAALAEVPNARVETYDGERLPFDDASFDAAVAVLVLQLYFDRPEILQRSLGEIARVLRPGGRLWLIERAGPAGEEAWTLERWGKAMSGARLGMRASMALRGYRTTPMGWLAQHGALPAGGLRAAASAELAYNHRRGVRAPYTECLIEAVRL